MLELKKMFEEVLHISVDNQAIIFNGNRLENPTETLSAAGMQPGSTVHLVVHVRHPHIALENELRANAFGFGHHAFGLDKQHVAHTMQNVYPDAPAMPLSDASTLESSVLNPGIQTVMPPLEPTDMDAPISVKEAEQQEIGRIDQNKIE